jgi:hypothetical protein
MTQLFKDQDECLAFHGCLLPLSPPRVHRVGTGSQSVVPLFPTTLQRVAGKNGIVTNFKGKKTTEMRRITNFSSENSRIASEWPEFQTPLLLAAFTRKV